MFNEGDGDVAKGRGELGANPSPPNLLVSVVACPENASVECVGHNCRDVGCVDSTLRGVANVVPANVGMVKGIVSGFGVDCECVGGVLTLVVVGSMEGNVRRSVGKVAVEMGPKLWNG